MYIDKRGEQKLTKGLVTASQQYEIIFCLEISNDEVLMVIVFLYFSGG
jgi:hypothetical protein